MSGGFDVVLSVSGLRGDLNRFMKNAAGPDEIIWKRTRAECALQMIEAWQEDKSVPFAEIYEGMRRKFGMPSLQHESILPSVDEAAVQVAIAKLHDDHALELQRMKAVPRKRTKLSLAALCPPTAEELDMPWEFGRRRWLWGLGVYISDPQRIGMTSVARGHTKTTKYEFVGHGNGHYEWFASELASRFPELDFTMICWSRLTDDEHWLAAAVAAKGEWHIEKHWSPRENGCPGKWSQPKVLARFLDGKALILLRMLKKELAAKALSDRPIDPSPTA